MMPVWANETDEALPTDTTESVRKAPSRCGKILWAFLLGSSSLALSSFHAPPPLPPPIELKATDDFKEHYGHDLTPFQTAVVLYAPDELAMMFPEDNHNRCKGITCVGHALLRRAIYDPKGKPQPRQELKKTIERIVDGERLTLSGFRNPRHFYDREHALYGAIVSENQDFQPFNPGARSLSYYKEIEDTFASFDIPSEATHDTVVAYIKRLSTSELPEFRPYIGKPKEPSWGEQVNSLPKDLRESFTKALLWAENRLYWDEKTSDEEALREWKAKGLKKTILGMVDSQWFSFTDDVKNKYTSKDIALLKEMIDRGYAPRVSVRRYGWDGDYAHAVRIVGYLKEDIAGETLEGFYVYDPVFPNTARLSLGTEKKENGRIVWKFHSSKKGEVNFKTAPDASVYFHPDTLKDSQRYHGENPVLHITR